MKYFCTSNIHGFHIQHTRFSYPIYTVLISNLHGSHIQSTRFSYPMYTVLISNLHGSHIQSTRFSCPIYTVLMSNVHGVLMSNLHGSHIQSTRFSYPIYTVLISNLHGSHIQSTRFSYLICGIFRELEFHYLIVLQSQDNICVNSHLIFFNVSVVSPSSYTNTRIRRYETVLPLLSPRANTFGNHVM